jgi:N-acyl-D-amino-acid deacylase
MADLDRPATPGETAAMRALADEALAAGAIGVSTGLYYEPARAATTEEVIEVCRPLTARKGIYCTHMRDEGDHVVDSLEETFRIGPRARRAGVVSHHKVVGTPNHGRSAETLRSSRRRCARSGRPRLLSVLRVVDHPVVRPHAHRIEDAGHVVEAAPGVFREWT